MKFRVVVNAADGYFRVRDAPTQVNANGCFTVSNTPI
jgi:hypothetical protein